MPNSTLIFVYNADSGIFNTLADIAHKITSPQTYSCELCLLTHGHFTVKKAWQRYLDNSHHTFLFFHRDEFRQKYPDQAESLPAVFIARESGIEVLIDKNELEALDDVQALIDLIRSRTA